MNEEQTPRFDSCRSCGKHGRCVDREGSFSTEVYSQSQAREVIECGIQEGAIKSSEVHELFRQIKASGLPRRDEDADPTIQELVHLWNWVRRTSPAEINPDPEEMHEISDECDELMKRLESAHTGFQIIDLRRHK